MPRLAPRLRCVNPAIPHITTDPRSPSHTLRLIPVPRERPYRKQPLSGGIVLNISQREYFLELFGYAECAAVLGKPARAGMRRKPGALPNSARSSLKNQRETSPAVRRQAELEEIAPQTGADQPRRESGRSGWQPALTSRLAGLADRDGFDPEHALKTRKLFNLRSSESSRSARSSGGRRATFFTRATRTAPVSASAPAHNTSLRRALSESRRTRAR